MWTLMVIDADNITRTPVLYRADSEKQAKQILKNSFVHLVEMEDMAEMIESFEWKEFGDRNLRLKVTYNNGCIEDYAAIEVKDYYSKYDEFGVYWFSDIENPFIETFSYMSKIKSKAMMAVHNYTNKTGATADTSEIRYDSFLNEEDENDRYCCIGFSNEQQLVIRRTKMMELNGKQFLDCGDYYE